MTELAPLGPLPPQPRSWDDIHAITGGLSGVPISEIENGRIDWEYDFGSGDMRPCGLASCEQNHGHGWLVALPGERYVHVGHVCARKYANPDKWRYIETVYRERRDREARDQALAEAREKAEQKKHLLANWSELDEVLSLQESFAQAVGGPFLAELQRRADKGRPRIEVEVELSEEVYQARLAMNADPTTGRPMGRVSRFESKLVGEIGGLKCLQLGKTPRDLHRQLAGMVEHLLKGVPETADRSVLRSYKESSNRLAAVSNQLNEAVVAARTFFSPGNLEVLLRMPEANRQSLRAIRRDGDRIIVERGPHWVRAA